MRDEDRPFRDAEVRLAEHAALRTAFQLLRGPAYTTVYRFLRRLDEADLEQTLSAVVQRLASKAGQQATVAVDDTGHYRERIYPGRMVLKAVTWRP
jgi:hypothetical protein